MTPELSAYGPLLDALRGVRWPARRAVGAAPPGGHRSTQRGTAGEFTEYRGYRQGDDPRTLDWKLLARSDRAFVKVSEDRALLTTWVLLDAGARMAYPADGRTRSKWDMACQLAMGLVAVAHAAADPVGVLVATASGPLRLSPRTRRGTVADAARTLSGVRAGGGAGGGAGVGANNGDSRLAPLLATVAPRSRVVVLSDALSDLDALLKTAASQVIGGTMLDFVHVVAREELDPPAGVHLARDPVDRAREAVLPARGRSSYTQNFAAFRADVAARWRAIGAGYREVCTDDDAARAVRAVIAGVPAS
jgi:uncharacterized protein (DUF58 family)